MEPAGRSGSDAASGSASASASDSASESESDVRFGYRNRNRTRIRSRTHPRNIPMKGPIAYISHYFPALTQTFVYREVLAMEEVGWQVVPFGIRRPTKGISADARAFS